MVGLSCACFCKLNNGGWDGALVTFCASTVAMYIRQVLTHRSMHPQINFCITAFVATTISGLMLRLPAFSQHADYRHGRQRAAAGSRLSVNQCRRRYV